MIRKPLIVLNHFAFIACSFVEMDENIHENYECRTSWSEKKNRAKDFKLKMLKGSLAFMERTLLGKLLAN